MGLINQKTMKVIIEIDEKTFNLSAALLTHKTVDTEQELEQMNKAVIECQKSLVEVDLKEFGNDAAQLAIVLGMTAIQKKLEELEHESK